MHLRATLVARCKIIQAASRCTCEESRKAEHYEHVAGHESAEFVAQGVSPAEDQGKYTVCTFFKFWIYFQVNKS